MINIFKKIVAYCKIPSGLYCYKIIRIKNFKINTKFCPYWECNNNYSHQNNGYCKYLKVGDWEENGTTFLWDQVKECGIKLGIGRK